MPANLLKQLENALTQPLKQKTSLIITRGDKIVPANNFIYIPTINAPSTKMAAIKKFKINPTL